MPTRDFLGNEWNVECMGCAINNGLMSIPGGLIHKSQYFCVHQDPLIPLSGFLVIASLRHIRSLAEMHEVEYVELGQLTRMTHQAIKRIAKIEYLTLVQEERSTHFHLWFFPWGAQVIARYGEPSLTTIRTIMADYSKQVVSDIEWAELQKTITEIREYLAGG